MKKAWNDVKSFVTIVMTIGLIVLLLVPNVNPPKEILALYCTSYGAVITYFFTRKENKELHGLGIKSVKKTVNKYNGIMEISSENNEFMVNVILYL